MCVWVKTGENQLLLSYNWHTKRDHKEKPCQVCSGSRYKKWPIQLIGWRDHQTSFVNSFFNRPLPPFPLTSWKGHSLGLPWWLNNSTRLSCLTWWFSPHRPRSITKQVELHINTMGILNCEDGSIVRLVRSPSWRRARRGCTWRWLWSRRSPSASSTCFCSRPRSSVARPEFPEVLQSLRRRGSGGSCPTTRTRTCPEHT